jgi:hypothetical protein
MATQCQRCGQYGGDKVDLIRNGERACMRCVPGPEYGTPRDDFEMPMVWVQTGQHEFLLVKPGVTEEYGDQWEHWSWTKERSRTLGDGWICSPCDWYDAADIASVKMVVEMEEMLLAGVEGDQ